MNPRCCGTESILKTFNTFEYFYCEECKTEVKESELPTMAYPAYGTKVTAEGFNLDWQQEIEDLFKGDIS